MIEYEVIRLPSYHCQYNPIEMMWAQVKRQIATKNITFKMVDVEKLMHETIDLITKIAFTVMKIYNILT